MTQAKELVRRGFEEGFNLGNLEVFDETLSADYHDHEATDRSLRSPEEAKGVYAWLKVAFPDLRFDIDDMAVDDEKVWTLVRFSGKHEGAFMGMPASGRRLEARQVHIHRVRDGRVTDHWAVRDDLSMIRQLQG